MEAVAAVGLATNILQLIQYAHKISSVVNEFRKSATGLPKKAEQFRTLARSVCQDVNLIINSNLNSNYGETFREHATNLQEHVNAYLAELEIIQLKVPGNWVKSYKAAFKAWSKKEQLEESMKKMDLMGSQVTMHIVTKYLPSIDVKLDNLHAQSIRTGSKLSQEMEVLHGTIKEMNKDQVGGIDLLRATKQWFADQETIDMHRRCLRTLYFPEVHSRQDSVKPAHQETFKWLLEDISGNELNLDSIRDDAEHLKQSSLCAWLHSCDATNNIFWITGKPGAGKSTLMKFVANHPLLLKHLESWIGSCSAVIVSYFFWNYGVRLEKSVEGLLRSLLFQILISHRHLISIAFPSQDWDLGGNDYQFPRSALEQALSNLLNWASLHDFRFFFLIDGLDEFDGREDTSDDTAPERELLSFLRRFRKLPELKICLSSRPWASFKNEFGTNRDLYINVQDLTRSDIRLYIQETLQKDPIFAKLAADNADYALLVEELMDTAQGVFLWVSLACHSLLDGVTNNDRVCDLQVRLRALPTKLKDMYATIIGTIRDQYWRQAARSLLLSSEPSGTSNGTQNQFFGILTHFFADDIEYTNNLKENKVDMLRVAKQVTQTEARITTITRGLLEATRPNPEEYAGHWTSVSVIMECLMSHGMQITVAHRTIGDFLQSDEIREFLVQKSGLQCSIRKLVLRSQVAMFQLLCSVIEFDDEASKGFTAHNCQTYAARLFLDCEFFARGEIAKRQDPPYWDDFRDAVCRSQKAPHLLQDTEFNGPFRHPELTFSAYTGALPQLQLTLKRTVASGQPFDGTECLLMAIKAYRFAAVEFLLASGINPNGEAYGTTPWIYFLEILYHQLYFAINRHKDIIASAMTFLQHGAHLNATCQFLVIRGTSLILWRQTTGREQHDPESLYLSKLSFPASEIVRHLFQGADVEALNLLPPKPDNQDQYPPEKFAEVLKEHLPPNEFQECPSCGACVLQSGAISLFAPPARATNTTLLTHFKTIQLHQNTSK